MINEKQLILKQNPENTLSQTLKNSFTTWISPECNFEELRNKAQYKDMVQLSKDNISLLTSLCSHRETPKLRKSIYFGMVVLLLLDIRNLLKTVTLLNICRNRHAIIAYVKIRTVAFI